MDNVWDRFKSSGCISARNALVEHYIPFVSLRACRVDFCGTTISKEDLVQEAVPSLMRAIDRFEPERKIRFETFASQLVWGAMQQAVYRYQFGPSNPQNGPAPQMILVPHINNGKGLGRLAKARRSLEEQEHECHTHEH